MVYLWFCWISPLRLPNGGKLLPKYGHCAWFFSSFTCIAWLQTTQCLISIHCLLVWIFLDLLANALICFYFDKFISGFFIQLFSLKYFLYLKIIFVIYWGLFTFNDKLFRGFLRLLLFFQNLEQEFIYISIFSN